MFFIELIMYKKIQVYLITYFWTNNNDDDNDGDDDDGVFSFQNGLLFFLHNKVISMEALFLVATFLVRQ